VRRSGLLQLTTGHPLQVHHLHSSGGIFGQAEPQTQTQAQAHHTPQHHRKNTPDNNQLERPLHRKPYLCAIPGTTVSAPTEGLCLERRRDVLNGEAQAWAPATVKGFRRQGAHLAVEIKTKSSFSNNKKTTVATRGRGGGRREGANSIVACHRPSYHRRIGSSLSRHGIVPAPTRGTTNYL